MGKDRFHIFALFCMLGGKSTVLRIALKETIFSPKMSVVLKLQDTSFTDTGSIVKVFADLTLWVAIKRVI